MGSAPILGKHWPIGSDAGSRKSALLTSRFTLRIAVFRGGALGDVVLTLPILQALRRGYPDSFITFVAPFPQAELAAHGHADCILDLNSAGLVSLFNPDRDLPQEVRDRLGADLMVSYLADPTGVVRKKLAGLVSINFVQGPFRLDLKKRYAVEQLAEPMETLGISLADPVPRLPVAGARAFSHRLAVHVASGSPKKNWPLENWVELLSRLGPGFDELVVVSGEADVDITNSLLPRISSKNVRLLQNRPLWDLVAELHQAALFVGHDTGVTHLAAAAGTPTVALFGPTDPEIWAPKGEHVFIMRSPDQAMDGISPESVHNLICKLRWAQTSLLSS
jgi:heptosyltransferase III